MGSCTFITLKICPTEKWIKEVMKLNNLSTATIKIGEDLLLPTVQNDGRHQMTTQLAGDDRVNERKKMCIYCRVSTEKETQEMSLSHGRKKSLIELADELDLDVSRLFKDKHSGFDIDREGLLKSSRFHPR